MTKEASPKSRLTALLLALFLWPFAAHRFYTGKWATAILQMITLGGFMVWVMIDTILIAAGQFKDARGRKLKNWSDED